MGRSNQEARDKHRARQVDAATERRIKFKNDTRPDGPWSDRDRRTLAAKDKARGETEARLRKGGSLDKLTAKPEPKATKAPAAEPKYNRPPPKMDPHTATMFGLKKVGEKAAKKGLMAGARRVGGRIAGGLVGGWQGAAMIAADEIGSAIDEKYNTGGKALDLHQKVVGKIVDRAMRAKDKKAGY